LKTLASCFERLILETKKKGVDFFLRFHSSNSGSGIFLGCVYSGYREKKADRKYSAALDEGKEKPFRGIYGGKEVAMPENPTARRFDGVVYAKASKDRRRYWTQKMKASDPPSKPSNADHGKSTADPNEWTVCPSSSRKRRMRRVSFTRRTPRQGGGRDVWKRHIANTDRHTMPRPGHQLWETRIEPSLKQDPEFPMPNPWLVGAWIVAPVKVVRERPYIRMRTAYTVLPPFPRLPTLPPLWFL